MKESENLFQVLFNIFINNYEIMLIILLIFVTIFGVLIDYKTSYKNLKIRKKDKEVLNDNENDINDDNFDIEQNDIYKEIPVRYKALYLISDYICNFDKNMSNVFINYLILLELDSLQKYNNNLKEFYFNNTWEFELTKNEINKIEMLLDCLFETENRLFNLNYYLTSFNEKMLKSYNENDILNYAITLIFETNNVKIIINKNEKSALNISKKKYKDLSKLFSILNKKQNNINKCLFIHDDIYYNYDLLSELHKFNFKLDKSVMIVIEPCGYMVNNFYNIEYFSKLLSSGLLNNKNAIIISKEYYNILNYSNMINKVIFLAGSKKDDAFYYGKYDLIFYSNSKENNRKKHFNKNLKILCDKTIKNKINSYKSFLISNLKNVVITGKWDSLKYPNKFKSLKEDLIFGLLFELYEKMTNILPTNCVLSYLRNLEMINTQNILTKRLFIYDMTEQLVFDLEESINFLGNENFDFIKDSLKSIKDEIKKSMNKLEYDLSYNNSDYNLFEILDNIKNNEDTKILLYGLSGTGKSEYAKYICDSIGLEYKYIKLSEVVSKWVGETEQNIEILFREADNTNKAIIFDECDSLFMSRENSNLPHYEVKTVNTILTSLDNYEGLIICTTNYIDNIDSAIFRRFDLKVKFSEMKLKQKEKMFIKLLKDLNISDKNLKNNKNLKDLDSLALTPGIFNIIKRKSRFIKYKTITDVISDLEKESKFIKPSLKKIGFL